mgnify:CR=1 FL=1
MLTLIGYLVLGAAETVVGLTEAFKPMQDRRGLYQTARAGQQAPLAATGTHGSPAPQPASTRFGAMNFGTR